MVTEPIERATPLSSGAPAETRHLGKVPALDGIRGIAIVLVMLLHLGVLTTFPFTSFSPLQRLADGGFLGVDLFFVLSGFLITALLISEFGRSDRIRLVAFYRRRALRLLPALAVLLIVFVVYALATHLPRRPVFQAVLATALYARNYVNVTVPPFTPVLGIGHLWSLSVEEQFYVVYPAILLVVLRARRRWVVPALLATLAAAVAIRRAEVFTQYRHSLTHLEFMLNWTDVRADGLLIGALAAWLWYRRVLPTKVIAALGWAGAAGALLVIENASETARWMYYAGWSVFNISIAAVVLACASHTWSGQKVLEWAPLRLLGRVSYGLYLWHLLVFAVIARYARYRWHWSFAALLLAAVTLTAGLTAASYFIVERPALRLKDRLEHRPNDGLGSVTTR